MGTKNNPGKFDCYANAEPDEPMFVLLARDKHAPTLVWLWAVLRELDQEDPEVVEESQECAVAMLTWAAEHKRECVGLGQAILAGTMELIRMANVGVRLQDEGTVTGKTMPTPVEFVRRVLAETRLVPKDLNG